MAGQGSRACLEVANAMYDAPLLQIAAGISGANAALALTLPAPSGGHPARYRIAYVAWSYDAAPSGGRLTITGLEGDALSVDITSAGPGALRLPMLPGKGHTEIVATLAAGGSGVSGRLNVAYMVGR